MLIMTIYFTHIILKTKALKTVTRTLQVVEFRPFEHFVEA